MCTKDLVICIQYGGQVDKEVATQNLDMGQHMKIMWQIVIDAISCQRWTTSSLYCLTPSFFSDVKQ